MTQTQRHIDKDGVFLQREVSPPMKEDDSALDNWRTSFIGRLYRQSGRDVAAAFWRDFLSSGIIYLEEGDVQQSSGSTPVKFVDQQNKKLSFFGNIVVAFW